MKSIKNTALFALTLAVILLPALAYADDMMPNPTSMATDAATAKMKDSTQGSMDKTNAMKASGDQTMGKANAMTTSAKAMPDSIPQTATDKMTGDMSGMAGMSK